MPVTTENGCRLEKTARFPKWLPAWRAADIRLVDWSYFAAQGIRLIAVDLDNTLAVHGSHQPDQYARDAAGAIAAAGLTACLYSNAAHQRDLNFAGELGISAIPNVAKPSPDALAAEMKRRGLTARQVLVVGDQLFTDIWSANRLGVSAMLAAKRGKKELFTIRLKRAGEAVVRVLDREAHARVPEAPALSVYMPR